MVIKNTTYTTWLLYVSELLLLQLFLTEYLAEMKQTRVQWFMSCLGHFYVVSSNTFRIKLPVSVHYYSIQYVLKGTSIYIQATQFALFKCLGMK